MNIAKRINMIISLLNYIISNDIMLVDRIVSVQIYLSVIEEIDITKFRLTVKRPITCNLISNVYLYICKKIANYKCSHAVFAFVVIR